MKRFYLSFPLFFALISCGQRDVLPDSPATADLGELDTVLETKEWTADITRYESEYYYREALYWHEEGYTLQAVSYLELLTDNNVSDKYVYRELLSYYEELVSIYQYFGSFAELSEILEKSVALGEKALEEFPENLDIWHYYAEALRASNLYSEFLSALESILAIDENDVMANYYNGVVYFSDGDYESAFDSFERVTENADFTDNFHLAAAYSAYDYLGTLSVSWGDFESAKLYYQYALYFVADSSELLQKIGYIDLEYLNFEDAVFNLSQVELSDMSKDLAESYAGALFVLYQDGENFGLESYNIEETDFDPIFEAFDSGGFLSALQSRLEGDFEASETELNERGFNIYGQFYYYYLRYQNAVSVENFDQQMEYAFLLGSYANDVEAYDLSVYYYQILEEKEEAVPEIYWLIGSVYDQDEDYENAVMYYEKYLKFEDAESLLDASIRLAYMNYQLSKKDEVKSVLEQAKSYAEDDTDLYKIYFYSGLLNTDFGNYEEALSDYEKAQELFPESSELGYFVATTYYSMGEISAAADYLKVYRETVPGSAEVNNLLAYLYALLEENLDDALLLIEMSVSEEPENIYYLDTLGFVYYQRGEMDEAAEAFFEVEDLLDDEEDVDGLDELYYHLGLAYELEQNLVMAKYYYNLGLELNPENEEILKRLDALSSQ